MASFSIPLTGLKSATTELNTIANNLANMNTTGFKSKSVNFSDLFYQQLGSTGSDNPIQLGAGTQIGSIETDFTSGTPDQTGVATDVAIDGNGFFVLQNGQSQVYSRAGDFSLSSNGQLISSNGYSVMGYPATNGVVNTNAPLTTINIPVGQVQQPQATTTFNMTANLDASTTDTTAFPAQVTIYDSLGVDHVATVSYTRTGTNTWDYSISLPDSDFTPTGTPPVATCTPVTGTLTFDSNGDLATVTPSTGTATPVGTGTGETSTVDVGFAGLADGASDLTMKWNLLGTSGTPNISQVGTADSAVSATSQDGFASGQYQGFSVGSDGTVTVSFSNKQTLAVGKLALADVPNEQGLEDLGNSDYAVTRASGTAVIGSSGTNGLGTLIGGALEASNVNISSEFSNLIIAQRAFEASSKAVTTFDTVTQETINMIH